MIKFPLGKLLQLPEQLEESLMNFLWEADSYSMSRELKEQGLEFDIGSYINSIHVAISKEFYLGLIAYHTYYESHMVLIDMFELDILGNITLDNRMSNSNDYFSGNNIWYLSYANEDSDNECRDYISLQDFFSDGEIDLLIMKYDYKTLVKVLINKSVLLNRLSFGNTSSRLGINKELNILLNLQEGVKKDIELIRELRIKRLKSVYDSSTY